MRRERGTMATQDKISPTSPPFLFGIPLFIVNYYMDAQFDVPLAELVVLGLIVMQLLLQRRAINLASIHGLGFIMVALVLWVTAVDYYHDGEAGKAIRVFARTFIYFALIVGYLYLSDKKAMFDLIMGLLTGYVLYFLFVSLVTFATVDSSAWFQLKYIIPTPAIIALVWLGFRDSVPKPVMYLMLGCVLYCVPAMILIGSRGAFLSLIVGMLAYGAWHYLKFPRWLAIFLALFIPMITIVIGAVFYHPDKPMYLAEKLFEIDYATHSNVERTLMITASIRVMKEEPVLGVGTKEFIPMIEPYFVHLSDLPTTTAESPHNYYLEFSVPFGLPSMALLLLFYTVLYAVTFLSVERMGLSRGIAAFAMIVIGWTMLYQPLSGNTRLDVFIILFLTLYGIQNRNTGRKGVRD